jgi:MFS family permease
VTSNTASGRPPLATLATATMSITVCTLPVFLLGALAVFIREELAFGESRLGATVSVYYLSCAVMSVTGGWFAEWLGARRAMALAATGTAVSMIGAAVWATSWSRLVACMVVAGMANGAALPATNLALARGIPSTRQGVAFGLKQSAGPFATLLAGAAVPALGVTVGWRWAFAVAGVVALPLIAVGWSARSSPVTHVRAAAERVRAGPLVLLACAAAAAVIGGSSLGAFYVESAVSNGIAAGTAGTLLAIGSVVGVCARVGWGWVGDRRASRATRGGSPGNNAGLFVLIGGLMACGAAGFALLGMSGALVLVVATFVVFATGWAWPGVFIFAVVRRNSEAPAVASGITGSGQFAGGIIGPLAFGALVERASYQVAWLSIGVCLCVACVLVLIGARWLQRIDIARAAEKELVQ